MNAKRNIDFGKLKDTFVQAHHLGQSKEAEDIISSIMRYMYEYQLRFNLDAKRIEKVDWEASLRHYVCYFGISKPLDSALRKAAITIPKRPHEETCEHERVFVPSIIHFKLDQTQK